MHQDFSYAAGVEGRKFYFLLFSFLAFFLSLSVSLRFSCSDPSLSGSDTHTTAMLVLYTLLFAPALVTTSATPPDLYTFDASWPKDNSSWFSSFSKPSGIAVGVSPVGQRGSPVEIEIEIHMTQRGDTEHPITTFDRDGNVLRRWGHPHIVKSHGLRRGFDDHHLWVTDMGDYTVKLMDTATGIVLKTLGTPGTWGTSLRPLQFGNVSDVSVSPDGKAIFIADGDCLCTAGGANHRVVRVSTETWEVEWAVGNGGGGGVRGSPSSIVAKRPPGGSFQNPHAIDVDPARGWLWVADREHNRTVALDMATGEARGVWSTDDLPPSDHRPSINGLRVDAARNALILGLMPAPIHSAGGIFQLSVWDLDKTAGSGRGRRRGGDDDDNELGHGTPPPAAAAAAAAAAIVAASPAIVYQAQLPVNGAHEIAVDPVNGDVYVAFYETGECGVLRRRPPLHVPPPPPPPSPPLPALPLPLPPLLQQQLPNFHECDDPTSPPHIHSYHAHVLFHGADRASMSSALGLHGAFLAYARSVKGATDPRGGNNNTFTGLCPMAHSQPSPAYPYICPFPFEFDPAAFPVQPGGPFEAPNFSFFVPKALLAVVAEFWETRRRTLDVLIHANTGCQVKDHTDFGMWLGRRWEMNQVGLACCHNGPGSCSCVDTYYVATAAEGGATVVATTGRGERGGGGGGAERGPPPACMTVDGNGAVIFTSACDLNAFDPAFMWHETNYTNSYNEIDSLGFAMGITTPKSSGSSSSNPNSNSNYDDDDEDDDARVQTTGPADAADASCLGPVGGECREGAALAMTPCRRGGVHPTRFQWTDGGDGGGGHRGGGGGGGRIEAQSCPGLCVVAVAAGPARLGRCDGDDMGSSMPSIERWCVMAPGEPPTRGCPRSIALTTAGQ